MKILRTISVLLLVFMLTSAFTMRKKEVKPVYVVGVSLCFGDSVVYFTNIQQIDSVRLTKDGFLPSREGYSNQLQSYMETTDRKPNHTCITYFADKKAELQKTVSKLMKRYQSGNTIIKHISPSDFSFERPIEE